MVADRPNDEPQEPGASADGVKTGRWKRFASSHRFLPQKPLTAIAAFVAFLAAVAAVVSKVEDAWPRPKKSDIDRVHTLSLGSDIDAVERNLGTDKRLTTYSGNSGSYRMGPQGPTQGLSVRIYRLHRIFVQVGYQTASGTVVEWVVQSCDPNVKINFLRSHRDAMATLNQTTLYQMTSGSLPVRAQYRTPTDGAGERLEFSAPDVASDQTSEIWGTNDGLCDSPWIGNGKEPLMDWSGGPKRAISYGTFKEVTWNELQRFRSGKEVNLYGQARPVDDVNNFPLLPGNGTPAEITGQFLPTPTSWPTPSRSAS